MSSLDAVCIANDLKCFRRAANTLKRLQMFRLIRIYAVFTCQKIRFLMLRLVLFIYVFMYLFERKPYLLNVACFFVFFVFVFFFVCVCVFFFLIKSIVRLNQENLKYITKLQNAISIEIVPFASFNVQINRDTKKKKKNRYLVKMSLAGARWRMQPC